MFAERIRMARESAGHTQESLAELLETEKTLISKWERGVHKPSLQAILSIADTLGVSVDYLLGRTENPTSDKPLIERVTEHLKNGDKMSAIREIATDGN